MDRLEAHRAQKEAVRDKASENTISVANNVSRYLLADAVLSGRREPARPQQDAEEVTMTLERPQPLVVAGLDDSAGGYLAVEQAAREAAWRGWRLRILHVQDAPLRPAHRDALRTAGAELLADGGDRARAMDANLAVSTDLRVGSAAGELISASCGAGLVVVGTRGRGGFVELTTGSVAHHVAAHAQSAVLVVRIPPRPAGLEWIEHPIIVGIDGSTDSYHAFEFAVAEARLRGVGVEAVHATPPEWSDSVDPLRSGPLAEFDEACLGVPIRRRLVDQDPRRALVGLSAQAGAVVVAARGHGGFPGLNTGSVTQALIHQAHSPVFIVRGPHVDYQPSLGATPPWAVLGTAHGPLDRGIPGPVALPEARLTGADSPKAPDGRAPRRTPGGRDATPVDARRPAGARTAPRRDRGAGPTGTSRAPEGGTLPAGRPLSPTRQPGTSVALADPHPPIGRLVGAGGRVMTGRRP